MHIQTNTSLHLHITTFSMHSGCSYDEWYCERASFHFTVARGFRLKARVSHDPHRSSLGLPPLCTLAHGGYAGEGDLLDESPLPNCSIRDIVLTERDTQVLPELRRASAMALPRCIVSRYATAWAESLEGAISGHQTWALLCHRLGSGPPLKLRLQMWETGQIIELISKILVQQHAGPLRRTNRTMQPQTDEQRGNRACALTARGSISKAMKELVGGAAQGSANCQKNWTTAIIPRRSVIGTHPTSAECAEAARIAWGGWKVQTGTERDEGARPNQNRYRFDPARQTGAHECSGANR